MIRIFVLGLTLVTGFTALVYEVVWQRYVAILLGSDSESTAAVLGLFLGKQLGIMVFVFGAHRTGIVHLPAEASWRQVYGVAILCGIGFTMSLFIGLLAFSDADHIAMTKLTVLAGSLLSAFAGAAVLLWPKRKPQVAV